MGIIRIKEGDSVGKAIKMEWDTGVTFEIRDIPQAEKNLIIEMSKDTSLKRQKEEGKTDPFKLGKFMILKLVVGWENVKNKHLTEIFDVEKFKFTSGTDANENFNFGKENLRELSDLYSQEFLKFLTEGIDKFSRILKEAREKDLKNL